MPPTAPDGPTLSADELNERIRALFTHRDARLNDEQRAEYQRLLAALQAVERGDVTEAA
jgi:Mor family transcriptional regulator